LRLVFARVAACGQTSPLAHAASTVLASKFRIRTSVNSFTLPGSQVLGQYSTQFNPAPNYISASDASFEPDIPINIRSTDYFARFDPVMAAILARSPGPPPAPGGSVITVNGASYRTDQGVSAGSLAAAFGQFSVVPDGVTVSAVVAQVISASASQVNFIVPPDAAPGVQTVTVTAAGQAVAAGSLSISAAGPGVFVLQPTNPQQPGAIENQDYSVNGSSNPTSAGSVIQIFATGYAASSPIQVLIGDAPAQIFYSGSVGPGLWQINAVIPVGATGLYPVYIVANGVASNAATVAVH
jgi:uncharacterized protein (TIGR03437 family)